MAAAAPMVKTKAPGIYRRGSRYVVVYRDAHGKQRKESARTFADARALKAKREREVATGEFTGLERVPFQTYATDWVKQYPGSRRNGISERTREEYRRDLDAYAFRFFGPKVKLAALGTRDLQRFANWLRDPAVQGRQLRARTVRRVFAPVSACLATAKREGVLRFNPAAGVVIPGDRDPDATPPKAMTRKELAAVLAAVEPEWRLFFETLAATGARWSEAVAWRWSDATLLGPKPRLHVRRAAGLEGFKVPKSEHSRRPIPIAPGLAARLAAERVAREAQPGDLIFPSRAGTVLRQENVRRRVLRPAAAAASVPWIGFHSFRHTAASMMFANGQSLLAIQRILGHHSASFTLATYLHLIDDAAEAALDLDAELTGAA